MVVRRLSFSFTPELDRVLRALAGRMQTDLSRLAELLLRENPTIQQELASVRGTFPTKRGRDVQELLAIARASRGVWDERIKRGQVKIGGDE